MSLTDEVNKPLTEREMLLLVSEKLTTLNTKVDEIRADNACKYETLNREFKDFREDTNKRFNIAKGAGLVITGLFMVLQAYIQYVK